MKLTYKPIVITLFVILTGCTINHDYVWKEYPITPDRISLQINFTEGQQIRLIKGKSPDSKIFLGHVGAHHYYGTLQSLTDGIVDQLAKEMENRGLTVNNAADKSLEITVNRSQFERGMWKIAATIELTVKFGNGNTKYYTVRNSSPATVDRTYDGVVAIAVIELIKDPEVLTYINTRKGTMRKGEM
jgi:hypothetical protein